MIVPLGKVLNACKSDAILGIDDREKAIDYVERAVELAAYKANWNPWLAVMDICSDACGVVTFPTIVGTILGANVCGRPTTLRGEWYEWHVNGLGTSCGMACGFTTDMGWSPVLQDLREWSVVAALCEDEKDGDGSLKMIVEGETMDANQNPKEAITIPATGPSTRGVEIPLIHTWASTDAVPTYFRKITRVTKPVTRGYVKLIAFPIRQMALSVNLGYYAPNETNPTFRRLKSGVECGWVRVKFRRASIALVDDTDIVPLGSYQATLDLIKSIRLSDSNNVDLAEVYLQRAVRLLSEVQSIESGSTYVPMQIQPGWGIGCIDFR